MYRNIAAQIASLVVLALGITACQSANTGSSIPPNQAPALLATSQPDHSSRRKRSHDSFVTTTTLLYVLTSDCDSAKDCSNTVTTYLPEASTDTPINANVSTTTFGFVGSSGLNILLKNGSATNYEPLELTRPWTTTKEISSSLSVSSMATSASGAIYADMNGSYYRIDQPSNSLASLVQNGPPGELEAADANGDLFIDSYDDQANLHNVIELNASNYNAPITIGPPDAASLTLKLDPSGNLWVIDVSNVKEYAPPYSGAPVWSFKEPNGSLVAFDAGNPSDAIAFDSAGHLFITDGVGVSVYNVTTHQLLATIKLPASPSGPEKASAVAVDPTTNDVWACQSSGTTCYEYGPPYTAGPLQSLTAPSGMLILDAMIMSYKTLNIGTVPPVIL